MGLAARSKHTIVVYLNIAQGQGAVKIDELDKRAEEKGTDLFPGGKGDGFIFQNYNRCGQIRDDILSIRSMSRMAFCDITSVQPQETELVARTHPHVLPDQI